MAIINIKLRKLEFAINLTDTILAEMIACLVCFIALPWFAIGREQKNTLLDN